MKKSKELGILVVFSSRETTGYIDSCWILIPNLNCEIKHYKLQYNNYNGVQKLLLKQMVLKLALKLLKIVITIYLCIYWCQSVWYSATFRRRWLYIPLYDWSPRINQVSIFTTVLRNFISMGKAKVTWLHYTHYRPWRIISVNCYLPFKITDIVIKS